MNTTLSHVHGATGQPLIHQTIGDLLQKTVDQWPDREAIVVRHQGIRWTYRQFGKAVDEFAAGLLALDLQPGEYRYSFILDGSRRVADPTVWVREKDDFGAENSVLEVRV